MNQIRKSAIHIIILLLPLIFGTKSRAHSNSKSLEFTYEKVQNAFNRRCVACHSCYESPCQLNLQSFEGVVRGAKKEPVYQGTRLKSVPPTRLGEDSFHSNLQDSIQNWRENYQFFDVIGQVPDFSLLRTMIMGKIESVEKGHGRKPVHQTFENEHWQCPKNETEYNEFQRHHPEAGMPYGFYADHRNKSYLSDILQWVARGATGPTSLSNLKAKKAIIPERVQSDHRAFIDFLNGEDLKHRLVARYLFEHLFLAHIYFTQSPRDFFQIVRSRKTRGSRDLVSNRSKVMDSKLKEFESAPGQRDQLESVYCRDLDLIATRRPNDDPGTSDFEYCLRPIDQTIVTKNHIPYEVNAYKVSRWHNLFFGEEWDISKLPKYDRETASNPFATFAEIPVRARYQFLLDDAQYEVSTFTKGPVCNGSFAVNSIQDQFYVFFLKPDSDVYVRDEDFREDAEDLLVLPGAWGSDVPPGDVLDHLDKLRKRRNKYWDHKYETIRKEEHHLKGFSLSDIWDGDGYNDNAVLTVFRHNDNAYVAKGALGDVSKTAFLLDYTLLERMVYNLVVDFDVFGNAGHQYLTRTYMDFIRIEAEENFLTMLTPPAREVLRKFWNSSFWPTTQLILKLINNPKDQNYPTQIQFKNIVPAENRTTLNGFERKLEMAKNQQSELIRYILFNRFNADVRGTLDPLNWKQPDIIAELNQIPMSFSPQIKILSHLTAIPVSSQRFPLFFPDVAYLLVEGRNNTRSIYTIIHNKEFTNLAWMLGEDQRRSEEEDTLTIAPGFRGTYPNYFFKVQEVDLRDFVLRASEIRDLNDYKKLQSRYGVDSMSPEFWKVYDLLVDDMTKLFLTESGFIDLSRYEL